MSPRPLLLFLFLLGLLVGGCAAESTDDSSSEPSSEPAATAGADERVLGREDFESGELPAGATTEEDDERTATDGGSD